MTDLHLAAGRQDGAARIRRAIRQREIGVGEDDAEHQHEIGVIDQPRDRGIPGRTEIGAGNHVVLLFQKTSPHEGRDHRQVQLACQRRDLVLDAIATDFHIDHRDRSGRRLDPLEDFIGTFGERARVRRPRRQRHDGLDFGCDHVAGKFEIDRQRHLAGAAQHARDQRRRGSGIGQHRLVAGDLPEHGELRVDSARLVMQQEAAGALARTRRARNHDNRRAFRIGARDGIDQIERAGAIGHHGDAETAMVARRGVRREAHRRLMAQREVRQDVAFLDDLEQRQHEVAGNAEYLVGAVIFQGLEQSGGKRGHDKPLGRVNVRNPLDSRKRGHPATA